MRIKDHYKVRKIANENIIVEQGNLHTDFTKVISFNPTAIFLWDALQGKDFATKDVAGILMKEYHIPEEQAVIDAQKWIDALSQCGIIQTP